MAGEITAPPTSELSGQCVGNLFFGFIGREAPLPTLLLALKEPLETSKALDAGATGSSPLAMITDPSPERQASAVQCERGPHLLPG